MPSTTVLTDLLGRDDIGFRGSKWSNDPAVFRSEPEWFQRLASLDVLLVPSSGSIVQPNFFPSRGK